VGGKIVCKTCAQNIANKNISPGKVINRKEPVFGLILSFFIPGLGQVYNGDLGKGLVLFIAAVISVCLMFLCIGFVTYIVIWLYSMFDAYNYAEKINRGDIRI
jgi:TM2 domain-containing membrane protein YozV